MSTFAVEEIEAIRGKQTFYKLIVDGKAPIDEFEDQLETKYDSELSSMYLYMEQLANLRSLPETKFKELKGSKDGVKEYEFRTKNLRIYVTKHPESGKIVVMGGYKNSQKKDINSFRNLKKNYLESLK